jgi:hypothetical protein
MSPPARQLDFPICEALTIRILPDIGVSTAQGALETRP